MRVQPRRAEDDVALKILQIIFAKMQLRALALEIEHLGIQIPAEGFVAAGRFDAVAQQQTHQRAIAHADAQHQYALALQLFKI